MHSVFTIPELVQTIVESTVERRSRVHRVLHPPQDDHTLSDLTRDSWNALKALRLTSKAFQEPCLDAMWHFQTSLVPLFKSVGIVVTNVLEAPDPASGATAGYVRTLPSLLVYAACSDDGT